MPVDAAFSRYFESVRSLAEFVQSGQERLSGLCIEIAAGEYSGWCH